MSEVERGWIRADAEPAESWVLASSVVGWVARAKVEVAEQLLADLQRLEKQRDALAEELAAERLSAREQGVAEATRDVAAVVDELRAERRRLVSAAAEAAIQIAVGIVGDAVAGEPPALESWVSRALGESAALEGVTIEVAPSMVDLVTPLVANPVRAGVGLGPTDARVLMPDGKREFRLSAVLAQLRPGIEAALEGE